MKKSSGSVHRQATLARILSLGLIVGVAFASAGCSHKPAAEAGSWPAASKNECLPAVKLVDQHGKIIDLTSLKGKPVLVDFIYTSCKSICPVLTAKFRFVAKLLGPQLGPDVTMLSFTIDPEHDNPPTLLNYAKSEGAKFPGWHFLWGPPPTLYKVLDLYNIHPVHQPDGSIGHVAMGFLLGPNGYQVRQYDLLEASPKTIAGDVASEIRQARSHSREIGWNEIRKSQISLSRVGQGENNKG
ncbi:MAG: SCO family protein [Candidatus Binataceae bacterium]